MHHADAFALMQLFVQSCNQSSPPSLRCLCGPRAHQLGPRGAFLREMRYVRCYHVVVSAVSRTALFVCLRSTTCMFGEGWLAFSKASAATLLN